jgi:hypothetical protein
VQRQQSRRCRKQWLEAMVMLLLLLLLLEEEEEVQRVWEATQGS